MDFLTRAKRAHPGMTRINFITASIKHTFAFPRRLSPELCLKDPPKNKGVGNAGCHCTRSLA